MPALDRTWVVVFDIATTPGAVTDALVDAVVDITGQPVSRTSDHCDCRLEVTILVADVFNALDAHQRAMTALNSAFLYAGSVGALHQDASPIVVGVDASRMDDALDDT